MVVFCCIFWRYLLACLIQEENQNPMLLRESIAKGYTVLAKQLITSPRMKACWKPAIMKDSQNRHVYLEAPLVVAIEKGDEELASLILEKAKEAGKLNCVVNMPSSRPVEVTRSGAKTLTSTTPLQAANRHLKSFVQPLKEAGADVYLGSQKRKLG